VVVPAAKIGVLNLMVKAGLATSTSEARDGAGRRREAGRRKVADVRRRSSRRTAS
jgi:DNA-binding PadR family transcriptional regulator